MSDTLDSKDNMNRDQVDTPSNVTILDITEDCTRLVFDRLTLNQLIHLRAVCHAWNHIITDVCSKKHTLQLCFNREAVGEYFRQTLRLNIQDNSQFQLSKRNLLRIYEIIKSPNSNCALKPNDDGSFSDQQNGPNLGIGFIARLFPNITNFVCFLNHQRMFDLNYILRKWSTNLETLTMSFNDHLPKYSHKKAHGYFVQCFEQMISLRRLHLFGITKQFDILKVDIFGQLEELTFDNPLINFVPYFAKLDGDHCAILRVGLQKDCSDFTPNLPNANPELVSKLTHLSLSFIKYPSTKYCHQISKYCAKFQNLKYLEILNDSFNCSIADALHQIVLLPSLKTLSLNLNAFVISSRMVEYPNNLNYEDTFPKFHNTVTELHLKDLLESYFPDFPEFQDYQLLARTFPIVREIKIYSNNINETDFDAQFRPQFSGAFGVEVEVEFIQHKKYSSDDFY